MDEEYSHVIDMTVRIVRDTIRVSVRPRVVADPINNCLQYLLTKFLMYVAGGELQPMLLIRQTQSLLHDSKPSW